MSEAVNAVAPAPKSPKAVKPKVAKSANAKPKASHPTYLAMIVAAIRDLKDNSGSSRQALLKWIVNKYHVNADVAGTRLRIELKKGLANGSLKHGRSKFSLISRCIIHGL
jgi:hypothetical protein